MQGVGKLRKEMGMRSRDSQRVTLAAAAVTRKTFRCMEALLVRLRMRRLATMVTQLEMLFGKMMKPKEQYQESFEGRGVAST